MGYNDKEKVLARKLYNHFELPHKDTHSTNQPSYIMEKIFYKMARQILNGEFKLENFTGQ